MLYLSSYTLLQIFSLYYSARAVSVLPRENDTVDNSVLITATNSNITLDGAGVTGFDPSAVAKFWNTYYSGVRYCQQTKPGWTSALPVEFRAEIPTGRGVASKLLTDFKTNYVKAEVQAPDQPATFYSLEAMTSQAMGWSFYDIEPADEKEYNDATMHNLDFWRLRPGQHADPWTALYYIESTDNVPGEIASVRHGPWSSFSISYKREPTPDLYHEFKSEAGSVFYGIHFQRIRYQAAGTGSILPNQTGNITFLSSAATS